MAKQTVSQGATACVNSFLQPITLQSVRYLDGYRLFVTFAGGESGIVDLSALVQSEATANPLQNLTEFRNLFLDSWPTVAWPCGFALAPEYLYWLATGKKVEWLQ